MKHASLIVLVVGLCACASSVIIDDAGSGGADGDPDGPSAGGVGPGQGVTAAQVGVTTGPSVGVTASSGSGPGTCGDLPCLGEDNPESDCIACVQSPGGDCERQFDTCFMNPDCLAFNDCAGACPGDDPATPNVDEFLSCICTVDPGGVSCMPMSLPGTCIGDFPGGVDDLIAVQDCLFNTCTDGTCQ